MGGKVSRNIPKVLGYHQNSPTHSSVPPAMKKDLKRQFSYIADNYKTVEEVLSKLQWIMFYCMHLGFRRGAMLAFLMTYFAIKPGTSCFERSWS